jgi:hypothetical protein
MLCNLAFTAARRFHRSSTSIGETINEVLDRIAKSKPEQVVVAISAQVEVDQEKQLCA